MQAPDLEQMRESLGLCAPSAGAGRDPVRFGRAVHEKPNSARNEGDGEHHEHDTNQHQDDRASLGKHDRGASTDAALPSLRRRWLYSTVWPIPPLTTHTLHNR